MSHHVKDFYKQISGDHPSGHFHKVIALHEDKSLNWEKIKAQVPTLPRGWFELAQLPPNDRVEFTRDFWIGKLPYHLSLQKFLVKFFSTIEDVQVFLVQQKFDDPFKAHLVYSLKNEAGFFKGFPPALEPEIIQMEFDFPGIIFPQDYLAFLQIHNGFCKTTDCTGIFEIKMIKSCYDKLQELIAASNKVILNTKGVAINSKALIPFYESFGMPFYQCFFSDWYPEHEMGNVYYAANTNIISDVKNQDPTSEAMALPTFSDWLIFYLETIS